MVEPMMMPCELNTSYQDKQNGKNDRWVCWSRNKDDEFKHIQTLYTSLCNSSRVDTVLDHHTIRLRIRDVLERVNTQATCLIQFWAPINDSKGQLFLTTADQPFGFNKKLHHGFWLYRNLCLRTLISVDTETAEHNHGPPARVFQHGMAEFSPHVRYYTITEYPLRDFAMHNGVSSYWALPIFEPSRHQCIGVLEYVFEEDEDIKLHSFLDSCISNHKIVKRTGLSLIPVRSAFPQQIKKYWEAFPGIKEGLEVTCKTHKIPFAQTWIPVLDSSRMLVFMTLPSTKFYCEDMKDIHFFAMTGLSCVHQGEGLIGRVLSTRGSCFCGDITQLSIETYPLIPIARFAGLATCFAICLLARNSSYIVVEFLLPLDETLNRDPQSFLHELLATMKEQYPGYIVGSGQELGEKLSVEVIKTSPSDKLDMLEIGQSQPILEALLDSVDGMQSDFLNQTSGLSNLDADVGDNEREPNGEAVDTVKSHHRLESGSEAETVRLNSADQVVEVEVDALAHQRINSLSTGSKEESRTKRIEKEYGITREALECQFGKKLADAAKSFGVARSTLKRICRDYEIYRWPRQKFRKENHVLSQCGSLQAGDKHPADSRGGNQLCIDLSLGRYPSSVVTPKNLLVTMTETKNAMSIKVAYRNRTVRFPLRLSSIKKDLEEEVEKRLIIPVGSSLIKYEDEDGDWISITCDSDLHYGMETLKSLGRTTIKMLVET